jgi:hypothetical protein
MVNETIHSLHQFLDGLPLDSPIFVSVDGLPASHQSAENEQRRQAYIQRMKNTTFLPFTNVRTIPMDTHLHLAGSINRTLHEHVKTRFIYILQHDLPFCRHIDHTTLVQNMIEHPDTLFNVRFRLNNKPRTTKSFCPIHNKEGNYPVDEYHGMPFFATYAWSDNNHISSTAYYKNMLKGIHMLLRPMEGPMQYSAPSNCTHMGQQIYGERGDGIAHICHLDGRLNGTNAILN